MKKQAYTKPNCTAVYFDLDELLRAPGASSFDNDGDGNTDQRPIVPGDPDEIGTMKTTSNHTPRPRHRQHVRPFFLT